MNSPSSSQRLSETTSSSSASSESSQDPTLPAAHPGYTVVCCSIAPVVDTCGDDAGLTALLEQRAKDYGMPVAEMVAAGHVLVFRGVPKRIGVAVTTAISVAGDV